MISIVVPVYNIEDYIESCLESIAAQSYSDFEVVMVDDGSTDSSGDICRKWADMDRRFRIITKSNGGLSSARNCGIEASNGEFITFIDGDDAVHPYYLETMIENVRREYSIVGVGIERFRNELPIVSHTVTRKYHFLPNDAFKDMLYQSGVMINSACGKLYRRELIEGIRFKEGILYEDLEWMARVLERMPKSKRICMCDAPLYFYRKREGSLIETFSERRMDVLDVTREIEQRAFERGDRQILKATRDRRLSANFDMFFQMCAESGKKYEREIDGCWAEIRRLRLESLFNRHVRMKNKAGVLLSFLGKEISGFVGSRLAGRLKS